MRKIVFLQHAGFAGTDTGQLEDWGDNTTDDELSDYANELGLAYGESYGVEYDEEEECFMHDGEYVSEPEGWWEEYDPAKHDGLIT